MIAFVVVAFCSDRIAYVRGGMPMTVVFVTSTEEERAIRVAIVPLRVVADILFTANSSPLHDDRAREIVLPGRMMRRI